MLVVNYITSPWFLDIAAELVQELKSKVTLNFIIIISPKHFDFLGIDSDNVSVKSGKPFLPGDAFSKNVFRRFEEYFKGANVICKYEEYRETSFKNTIYWRNVFSAFPSILKADLNLVEYLNVADWFFLFKIRNRTIFHIIHDPVLHSGESKSRLEVIRRIYYPYINRFITYSEYSSNLFKEYNKRYNKKVLTFKMPIYFSQRIVKEKIEPKEKKKIVFFGRISPYKGVELFYSAASILAKEFEDVTFLIAGKTIANYTPSFFEENKCKRIIILNQFIDNETLSEIMTDAFFCVLPYFDATQSGVIMTCYAFDVPTLVSDCGGLLEYCLDEENFSFKNKDLDDLVIKMRLLVNDNKKIEDYKQRIKEYSLKNVSAKNTTLLLKALA